MLSGVAASLISSGVIAGGAAAKRKFARALRERKYSPEVDPILTQFLSELETAIRETATEQDNPELLSLTVTWDEVATDLKDADLVFEDEATAVDTIVETIIDANEIDLRETTRTDLRVVVTDAYQEAVTAFNEVVASDDELRRQLELEFDVETIERLNALDEQLQELIDQATAPQYYDWFDIPADGRTAASDAIAPRKIDFVSRPELDGYRDAERLLVLGPGGAGKSRALAELVAGYENTVRHVIRPREALKHQEHLSRLRRETAEGNVLLVWDDIHAISPETDNAVFRHAIAELEDYVLADEQELYVLAAARSENLDAVPGNPQLEDDPLWGDFETVELEALNPEILWQIFVNALETNGVEASEAVREKFLETALETDPSPLYVTSVVEIAGDRLTEADIEALPPDALTIWQDQYTAIKQANDRRRYVLWAAKLLGELDVPVYRSLLLGVYTHVLDRDELAFGPPVEELVSRQWLVPADEDTDATRYMVHDVKLEAIDEPVVGRFPDVSEFLLEQLEDRYLPAGVGDIELILHGQFALTAHEASSPDQDTMELARTHYEYIIREIDEDYAAVHYNYAIALIDELDAPKEAAEHFRTAIDLDPEHTKAHHGYATLLEQELDAPEEAAEHFETAIELDPEHIEAHLGYAILLEDELDAPEEAAECYQTAIDIDPEHAAAHHDYGLLLAEFDYSETARDHIETSVGLWLDKGEMTEAVGGLTTLVQVCRDLDADGAVIENCERALEIIDDIEDEPPTDPAWFQGVRALHDETDARTRYELALRNLRASNEIAVELFMSVGTDVMNESEAPPEALVRKADVGFGVCHELFDFDWIPLASGAGVLQFADRDTLDDPATAVYDAIVLDEASHSPEDLRSAAEDRRADGAELEALEAEAFAEALAELE